MIAKTLMFAQTMMICGYIPVICTPPYPVVIVSFFFLGVGMAMNLALGNVFAANLQNGTKMLGAMHGSYGVGGTIGPISMYIFKATRSVNSPKMHYGACSAAHEPWFIILVNS
jgi:MFS family permease